MNQSKLSQKEHSLELLGVGPQHSWDDIEKQYRQLVQRWHPDRNTGEMHDAAKDKFIEINSAYKYLRSQFSESASYSPVKTASRPHSISPEQTGPLLGTKNQVSTSPALYKNKLVIAGAVSMLVVVLFGALLWSLDSRLAENNRDRATSEIPETTIELVLPSIEPLVTHDERPNQSTADAAF